MKSTHDCIPCFIRQALDTARFATNDDQTIENVLREVLTAVSTMDLSLSPPAMARDIHGIIRRVSNCDDPYKTVKEHFNQVALDLYPDMKQTVLTSENPFETAVRLAIAGNIIDFGVNAQMDDNRLQETVSQTLADPLAGDVDVFFKRASSAGEILYLGDNAGELVFDRLLIESLPCSPDRVTFAVRGTPVINDATMDDARTTGMTDLVSVIDNGSDAPGTILDLCSEAFVGVFNRADLIIAKGQGNYESLSDEDAPVTFLLKAKCSVIAQHLDCRVGDSIISQR